MSDITLYDSTGKPVTLDGDRLKALLGGGGSANHDKGLAAAWVNFDGTTTPPTIRGSHNVSKVVSTAPGEFEITFAKAMKN